MLEVGAVYMDPDLRIDGAIETLVNPQRDVGPTHVHGITARDVFDAPTFDQVAPVLLKKLDGRVIVGHNVSFDLRFLTAELEREGYEIPDFVAIDTLQVAKAVLKKNPPATYKLYDITAHLGFGVGDAMMFVGLDDRPEHSALGDAILTTLLLSRFIQMSSTSRFWCDHLDRAEAVVWPEYVVQDVDSKRRGDVSDDENLGLQGRGVTSVSDVLKALGAEAVQPVATADYARLLDASLADRILDRGEIDALVNTASGLGLDGVTLGSLHRGYFDQVVVTAWADGLLTEEERVDIVRIAELLEIDRDSLQQALQSRETPERTLDVGSSPGPTAIQMGATIVLTGEMSIERSLIEAELVASGFLIGVSVTKRTSFVIAADPYTQSGKAKKARSYGIPVLGEAEGLALIRGTAR